MSDAHQTYLQSGMTLTVENCLEIVSKAGKNDDDRLQHVQHLRSNLSSYIREEQSYKDTCEALKALDNLTRAKIQGQEFDFDVEKAFKDLEKDYATQMTDVDVAKHAMTLRFEERARQIMEGNEEEEEASGPSTQLIEGEDDGDDIVMFRKIVHQDPYTKQTMKEPMKNKICGHHYDRATVTEMIQKGKELGRQEKCPISGCANRRILREEDLERDLGLKKEIKKQIRAGKIKA